MLINAIIIIQMTRVPLVRMTTIYEDDPLRRQNRKIRSYRLQTLWPSIALLEMSPPAISASNSSEITVEITGGLLHSSATPLVASLHLQQGQTATDFNRNAPTQKGETNDIVTDLTIMDGTKTRTAKIVASGNERLVFDSTFLGRIPGVTHQRISPTESWWSGFRSRATWNKRRRDEEDDERDVAIFQLSSRIEFPPTSLDFHIVGSAPLEEMTTRVNEPSKVVLGQLEPKNELKKPPTETEGSEGVTASLQTPLLTDSKSHLVKEKRWPSRESNKSVWVLWWYRQSQQLLVGLLMRRFHK